LETGDEHRYRGLSPFELKNELIELARHRGERMMLNAGRGNPNWIALAPRAAFAQLQMFALEEAQRVAVGADLGGLPVKRGLAARLRAWLDERREAPGCNLLARSLDHAASALDIEPDRLVGEWVDGVLGDHYPVPMRMLAHTERIVRMHLVHEVFGGHPAGQGFEYFAVEGASAGIAYVFDSLVASRVLVPGDRIALGVPIFTPYLDVPKLPEYAFDIVEVVQDEASDWRYPAAELDKLRDPGVRLFLAVNPSNPTAVAMAPESVERVARIAAERPDLLIVTDDVYASFVADYRSLAAAAPRNTLLIYSFSKYWGATGTRLGVVGLHAQNVLDARFAELRAADGAAARARYGSVATAPERMKFIDRMVADSRAVGLNHTAGLSTPQQVQMALFALDALLDVGEARKQCLRELLKRRFEALYRGAGLPVPSPQMHSRYYATLDVPHIARIRYGAPFAAWLVSTFEPIDFVVRLAREHGVVLLDGGGFDAPRMSVRVSLANLPDAAYEPVGRAIAALLADYHRQWLKR
jgi:aspartate 4-decarboxylase